MSSEYIEKKAATKDAHQKTRIKSSVTLSSSRVCAIIFLVESTAQLAVYAYNTPSQYMFESPCHKLILYCLVVDYKCTYLRYYPHTAGKPKYSRNAFMSFSTNGFTDFFFFQKGYIRLSLLKQHESRSKIGAVLPIFIAKAL